ncbi:MAG: TatD family hydrolase [Gemmatimonadaceae bacterium]
MPDGFSATSHQAPGSTFVDSHAHLADAAFDTDRDAVIARARAAGAVAIVCIGESIAAADRAHAIVDRSVEGFMHWTVGVHPHDAAAFDASRDNSDIRERVGLGAVAIGECGLDYHYDNSPRGSQRAAFGAQLALAAELARPIVVHTRDAESDTHAMIVEAAGAGVRGVLHCYTGSAALASAALAVGWYVSFSGIITFRKWTDDALLRLVPDDRLLAESDAPYLAPDPHRGARNEPAWVAATVARLASARGATAGAVGELVTANAYRLFALPAA